VIRRGRLAGAECELVGFREEVVRIPIQHHLPDRSMAVELDRERRSTEPAPPATVEKRAKTGVFTFGSARKAAFVTFFLYLLKVR
jgi:hypothetical protein